MKLRKTSISLLFILIFSRIFSPMPGVFAQSSMFTKVFTGGDGAAESSNDIMADQDGNLYITGSYTSTCIIGNDTLTLSGSETVFLAKCDPDSGFVWAAGPDCSDEAYGEVLTFDNAGSVYVSGYFMGQLDFGNGISLNSTYFETFIAKYSPSGQIIWAKSLTGDQGNNPKAIAGDVNGNIYIAGQFEGVIYFGSLSLYSFDMAVYVLKINQAGIGDWMVQSGGDGTTYPQSISIEQNDNVILTGLFYNGTVFGDHVLEGHGSSDIFICKLTPEGIFLWAAEAGGGLEDTGYSVVCGEDGFIYVNGLYGYQAFFGPFTLYTEGGFYDNDMFVVKMDGSGNFIWAESVDIACFNSSLMCIDSKSNLYMTNVYSQDGEFGPSKLKWSGYNDIYVLKMDKNGEILWAKGAGSQYEDRSLGIVLLPHGDLAITGYISSGAIFDSISPANESHAIYVADMEQFGNMVISEINYKSSDSLDTGDWVELRNSGQEAVDITGWTLKDGNDINQFNIEQLTVLNPGQYIVLCQDINKFSLFHPGIENSIGSFGFELAPNGEKIRLFDENGLLIAQVYYKATAPWPVIADTSSRTLEILDYAGELSDGTNWFAGCPGGSPGTDYFECGTAGLDDQGSSRQTIYIYPNPADDELNISFFENQVSPVRMTITNIAGIIILEESFRITQSGIQNISLNINVLPEGVYVVSIITTSNSYFYKLLITR